MGRFLEKLIAAPEVEPLVSDQHFSVDGTLLQTLNYASIICIAQAAIVSKCDPSIMAFYQIRSLCKASLILLVLA